MYQYFILAQHSNHPPILNANKAQTFKVLIRTSCYSQHWLESQNLIVMNPRLSIQWGYWQIISNSALKKKKKQDHKTLGKDEVRK